MDLLWWNQDGRASAVKAAPRQLSSADAAASFARGVQQNGGTVVFTNGVFDLLHPGHIRYLQQARALGDTLIVAVNSDRSVRALGKGADRPINPEQERAEVVLALGCVDASVIFDEDTPQAVIGRIQPDILVKGADWGADAIVGRDVVEARGGRVVRIDIVGGYSTTDIVNEVRQVKQNTGA
jgi:D-beta-D-heptose 7-phosphate kinase/D-beta-D-heptose 1-phosphate adenosyltransferase